MKKISVKRIVLYMFIPFLVFSLLIAPGAAANGPKASENADGAKNQNQHGNAAHVSPNQKAEAKENANGPKIQNQHGNAGDASPNQKAEAKENANGPKNQNQHGNAAHANSNQKEEAKEKKEASPTNNSQGKPPIEAAANQNKPPTESTGKKNEPTAIGNENANKSSGNSNGNKSTQIHLHLNKCSRLAANVYVQLYGNWEQMTSQGNSPLYKLKDGGEYVKDDISAFKLVMSDNSELIYPVADIRVGVEAQGTINYWLEKCDSLAQPVEEDTNVPGKTNPPASNPNNEGKEPPPSQDKETSGLVVTEIKTNQKAKENAEEKNILYSGALPKTGESSPFGYYLIGLLVVVLGIYLLRTRNTENA